MFLNISNHVSSKWSSEQLAAAKELGGEVRDIPFPAVPPTATTAEVHQMADELIYYEMAGMAIPPVVMVQGEMTLTHYLVSELKARDWCVVAACSERNTIENPDGTKTVRFQFVQFREY